MQGKGYVVRRMFADVDADVYVMADGDATYDASAAPLMVRRLLEDQLDMVVGARASEIDAAYRRGHRLGNVMLTGILARMFGRSFSDIRSEEHTSELQSLMRISYAVFCLKKKKNQN